MGKVTGFLEIDRADRRYAPASDRIRHYREFVMPLSEESTRNQAARCMNCGIPYCHTGCPVNNQIPDWNDLVYRGDWEEAARNLHSTNNFPEFTGRVCPAPCEASCTLNIEDSPVTIKTIECAIVDRAWRRAGSSRSRRRRRPASGSPSSAPGRPALPARSNWRAPAMTCMSSRRTPSPAACCATAFPISRWRSTMIDRRVEQMKAEGVDLPLRDVNVGRRRHRRRSLVDDYDAVVLAGGAEKPRDLPVPGRELDGVHFAMDFLPQQNRRGRGEPIGTNEPILASRQACRGDRRRRYRLRLHRHRRSARARCRSPSSKSCRCRRRRRTSC